jgi:hypothetical protein
VLCVRIMTVESAEDKKTFKGISAVCRSPRKDAESWSWDVFDRQKIRTGRLTEMWCLASWCLEQVDGRQDSHKIYKLKVLISRQT